MDILRHQFDNPQPASSKKSDDGSNEPSPWARHVLPGTGDRRPERKEFVHWRGLLPAGKASQIDLLPEPYQVRAKKLVEHFGDSGVTFGDFRTTPAEVAEAIGGPVDISQNLLRHLVNYQVMTEETTHTPNKGYVTKYRWRS